MQRSSFHRLRLVAAAGVAAALIAPVGASAADFSPVATGQAAGSSSGSGGGTGTVPVQSATKVGTCGKPALPDAKAAKQQPLTKEQLLAKQQPPAKTPQESGVPKTSKTSDPVNEWLERSNDMFAKLLAQQRERDELATSVVVDLTR